VALDGRVEVISADGFLPHLGDRFDVTDALIALRIVVRHASYFAFYIFKRGV
jgi:hypothetical protein